MFSRLGGLGLVLLVACGGVPDRSFEPARPPSFALRASEGKPDIVLIMADDMGYSDLGCYGGEIGTPNLDRLAAGGLRFTNFYSENMCWVTRASLLTGEYHVRSLVGGGLSKRHSSLPEALRSGGYQTLMSGKWHLGSIRQKSAPVQRGFDRYYGILGGAASFFAPASLTLDNKPFDDFSDDKDYYFTDAISDTAVRFVTEAERDKPMLLYLAYTAAHWPLHARESDIAKFKGRYGMGWDQLRRQRFARMKELGVIDRDTPLSPRNETVPAWEKAGHRAWQERRMEVYAAQVAVMDEGIGRVVEALKRRGNFENTLILFMIDNGGCHVEYSPKRKGSYLPTRTRDGRPMRPGNLPDIMPGPEETYQSYGYGWANASNTPYRLFKQYDHEGGIHTPMIAHWPRGIAGRGGLNGQLAHVVDIMPTVLEVTGATVPKAPTGNSSQPMAGIYLASRFKGADGPKHDYIYFKHAKGAAIRSDRWKLVRRDKGRWELYEIRKDPVELNNLAAKMPGKVAELEGAWGAWAKRR